MNIKGKDFTLKCVYQCVRQIHYLLRHRIINIVNPNSFPICFSTKNGKEDIAVACYNQAINLYLCNKYKSKANSLQELPVQMFFFQVML